MATYFVVAPYIAAYRLKWAAEKYGGAELSEFVDFPSVRDNLKDELNAQLADKMASDKELKNKTSSAATGLMLAGTMIDEMVDTLITPANIAKLIAEPGVSAGDFLASMGYDSFDRFSATIANSDGTKHTDLVFHRRGIGWKLTSIVDHAPGPVKPRWPWNWH